MAVALSRPDAAPNPRYAVSDLGKLVGASRSSAALEINERGDVIGWVQAFGGAQDAVLWRHGRAILIDPNAGESRAADINDKGQVAGDSYRTDPPGRYAFIWDRGSLRKLGTLGGGVTEAVAINNRGQVIGNGLTASGAQHAFIWSAGTITDLGTLGGKTATAIDLNDRGQIVGTSTTSTGAEHAFLWQRGRIRDLGTIGNLYSRPVAIDARGDVVGFAHPSIFDPTHALLWRNGRIVDLGGFAARTKQAVATDGHGRVLVQAFGPRRAFVWRNGRSVQVDRAPTDAHAINTLGQVVGRGPIARLGRQVPFIWQTGRAIALPTLDGVGPPFSGASALNDHGQIVGDSYTDVGGHTFDHAVLWTVRR
jgi:probable HAF family extracellular repeat protein